ncbi:aminotransferase class IV [Nonomuraea sp. B19D2]|uniref:aminotransferase class IV n=1 Tax=Nonomuraea sp. B19D2 TaxID=3159561 RepID=UPI0032DA3920
MHTAGHISECTAANLFVVRDGVLATPPVSAGALDGITQDTVVRLATDLGIAVERRNLPRSELYAADEVFVCGTAAEIAPVALVDGRELNGPGPVTSKLSAVYQAAVRGEDSRYHSWLTPVPSGG